MYIVDTHAHIYPCYDVDQALDHAWANLDFLAQKLPNGSKAMRSLILVERADYSWYQEARNGQPRTRAWRVEQCGNEARLQALRVGQKMWIIPGRQVVTLERLEVLGLNLAAGLSDGMSAAETIRLISDAGGIPVICWSLGKWWGERGKVLHQLLDTFGPDELLLGDTALRPKWPGRHSMAESAQGVTLTNPPVPHSVVAGSDPLPMRGEERYVGSYATLVPSIETLGDMKLSAFQEAELVGQRNNLYQTLSRVLRLRFCGESGPL